MRRKELFYYVTRGSNVTRDVHWCVTVDYQQIANGNIANQIHGFTIDYGKFILICFRRNALAFYHEYCSLIGYATNYECKNWKTKTNTHIIRFNLFTKKFSRTTTIYPGIFLGRVLWADSAFPGMNTIVSRDQFNPIRIGENLVVSYN